jgi:hypothetical protein
MWKHLVVFLDVEIDESPNGTDAVQRVEEKPLMFESASPRLDHGVRKLHSVHTKTRRRTPLAIKLVDVRNHVLDAGVRQHRRSRL